MTKIIKTISEWRQLKKSYAFQEKKIGFVPTMGALHSGHISLIETCINENDISVVSIFVNPAQFGPREDLKRYPRPLKNDLALCRKEKVDLVFIPESKMMYPEGFGTFVNVEKLSGGFAGQRAPAISAA